MLTTRESYVYKTYGKIREGTPKMIDFWKFLKIYIVSDKSIHMAFRFHKTLSIKPIREFNFLFQLFTNNIHWL